MIAVYIDKKIRQYENEIKYTFDFIFKTLGYEYKYIKTVSEILSNDILIYYGVIHPTLDEAYELVFRKIMFYIPFESELFEYNTLSAEKLRNCTFELEAGVPIFSNNNIFISELEEYNGLYYCTLGFDLVGNIFFHLDSGAQQVFGEEDNNDNKFENYNDIPFVNKMLQIFERELMKAYQDQYRYFLIKKEMWPQAEDMAFCISHTIDSLKKWDFKSILKFSIIDFFNFYRISFFFQTFSSKIKYLLTNYEEYWNFDKITELENQYNLLSTYFLGVDTHKDSFDYDIDDEDLNEELSKILNKKCEIALLAPEYSVKEDIYASQKKIISDLTNKTKIGVRQQNSEYNSKVTAELHDKNNFHYDSSQYCAKISGFKNGIASGFRYFRKINYEIPEGDIINFSLNHLEIPVIFAAGTLVLSRYKVVPEEEAKQLVRKLISNTKDVQGLFAFDFSMTSFANVKYSENLFHYIQKELEKIKTYHDTFEGIATWITKRDDVFIREKNRRINIYFPHYFSHFTCRILGDHKIAVIDYDDVKIVDNYLYFHNIPSDTNITIILEVPSVTKPINEESFVDE
jgi:hypothetical protein